MIDKLLEIKELKTYIPTKDGNITPVNNVSFSINKGEIVALVGESGSGKSVSALSIMDLNASEIKYDSKSQIKFHGQDLLKINQKEKRKLRGNKIAMIFQDPLFSLNPVHKIGKQITETILLHKKVKYNEAKTIALDLLEKVGISDVNRRFNEYPHQLSGGMRQRIMIAIALSCNPELLIADEPTTALDVTIQAQILNLLREFQNKLDISILLITHDLGVVAETADRVIVMYCGEIVEEGLVEDVFRNPLHPYTEGLLSSIPSLDGESKDTLQTIPGIVPQPLDLPQGCHFADRCMYAQKKCYDESPVLMAQSDKRLVSCWYPLFKKVEVTQNA